MSRLSLDMTKQADRVNNRNVKIFAEKQDCERMVLQMPYNLAKAWTMR